jgi:predicted membrane channel-forming protein YqfA (hemolysin III family)
MPPMPPRRRKYNIDVVEEEKPNSKRFKNSIMTSDRYLHQFVPQITTLLLRTFNSTIHYFFIQVVIQLIFFDSNLIPFSSSFSYNSRRNSRIDDDMSGYSQKRCIALFKEFACKSSQK